MQAPTVKETEQGKTGLRSANLGDASRPFTVSVDEIGVGHFEDLRDAIASAQIRKLDRPLARVVVADGRTGALVVEIEQR